MKQRNVNSIIFVCSIVLVCWSCSGSSDDDTAPGSNDPSWLIPSDEVFDGGPGKDGIPSVDNPQFTEATSVGFLDPNDLVLGIKVGNEIRAYPHPILDWHEIVNDEIDGLPLAITYCPLTGTGIAWDRRLNGGTSTFGVSGLLYNTNLIPYDRSSESNWSQMLNKSVNGSLRGNDIETYPMVETTWQTWKTMFPNSMVLNTKTGFSRNYSAYPYGTYRTNHELLLFPVKPNDNRLPRKQRGLGVIIDDSAKFYPFEQFDGQVIVQQDVFKNTELVIVGSKVQNFLVAYERRLTDGTLLDFEAIAESDNPVVIKDQEGNEWNVFGEAVAGPRQGTWLQPVESFIGYWFAWGAFYPNVEIF